jgi:hypothetical protein
MVVVVILLTLACAFVWFRTDDSPRPLGVASLSSEGPPPVSEVEPRGSLMPADSIEAPLAEPLADRLDFARELGARLHSTHSDPLFVSYLVDRGLSREDSERAVAEAFRDAAACWLMAGRARATADRISFDAAREAERGPSSTDTTYGPCIVSALQQAGIPLRQGPGFYPRPLTK